MDADAADPPIALDSEITKLDRRVERGCIYDAAAATVFSRRPASSSNTPVRGAGKTETWPTRRLYVDDRGRQPVILQTGKAEGRPPEQTENQGSPRACRARQGGSARVSCSGSRRRQANGASIITGHPGVGAAEFHRRAAGGADQPDCACGAPRQSIHSADHLPGPPQRSAWQRVAVQPISRALRRQTASWPWRGPTSAWAISHGWYRGYARARRA